jgi:hypothetical protein
MQACTLCASRDAGKNRKPAASPWISGPNTDGDVTVGKQTESIAAVAVAAAAVAATLDDDDDDDDDADDDDDDDDDIDKAAACDADHDTCCLAMPVIGKSAEAARG